MGRSPCCVKEGLKKGPWTPEEDQKLLAYIEQHGHGCWRSLPAKAGLQRCGKSCRLRWTNYLRPDIKRGKFSLQEEQTIIQLHALLGNRWSAIATHLPKRTDNEIKNYWNTHLKKRLAKMGIDPVTHKPRSDAVGAGRRRRRRGRAARQGRRAPQPHGAVGERAARGRGAPGARGQAARARRVHLRFSESAALASVLEAHGAAAAAAAAARAAMQPMQAYEEACKEHEQQQQQWGVHAADAAFAGAGFTGLLLDGALNQQDLRPAASRDDADADALLQVTEEEKKLLGPAY
ncbi:hypothetical protein PVAP13_7KG190555 [Panicum virgatum]|uniref:Uncharacterized protein n=1 Tax=Panicum virgatum TaxID=38727 RepID=A0A8T0QHE8_PANVG|nr:hypothetical protein PVAP13_7KG190555 [Panicum virgatum]